MTYRRHPPGARLLQQAAARQIDPAWFETMEDGSGARRDGFTLAEVIAVHRLQNIADTNSPAAVRNGGHGTVRAQRVSRREPFTPAPSRDMLVPVTCWCEREVVEIPVHDVGIRTESCGRPKCVG